MELLLSNEGKADKAPMGEDKMVEIVSTELRRWATDELAHWHRQQPSIDIEAKVILSLILPILAVQAEVEKQKESP